MDMLEITDESLYYEEPLAPAARELLDRAADAYGDPEAENLLGQASALEPEHPMVLVARYRYFFYQHRLEETLAVAEQVLAIYARRLGFPENWRDLTPAHLAGDVAARMAEARFYLLALKGAGLLELRLGRPEDAFTRLRKVAELDEMDRLGAQALLEVAETALNEANQEKSS